MIQPGKRIAVVGPCGSGKSYTAQALAERLGITYICNDAIIWRANWTQATREEEAEGFREATAAEAWTIDGNLNVKNEGDRLIVERADTLVWLDLPRREVWPQLLKRTVRRAWTREELWHGNRESWRQSFCSKDSILWWSFKSFQATHDRYVPWMTDPDFDHLIRIHLTSRGELDDWLDCVGKPNHLKPR